jgi:hypothetical protein
MRGAAAAWDGRGYRSHESGSCSVGHRPAGDDAANPLGPNRRAVRKEATYVLWTWWCGTSAAARWSLRGHVFIRLAQVRANASAAATDHVAGHVRGAQHAHGLARAQALVDCGLFLPPAYQTTTTTPLARCDRVSQPPKSLGEGRGAWRRRVLEAGSIACPSIREL